MSQKRYSVLVALFLFFCSNAAYSQCSIVSSNGWTATVTITPTQAVPEFTNCQWYYHYEVRYTYNVTFTGSTTGRSINFNIYFNCSGGTGGQPYNPMGTFTGNATGTMTTSNNSRQYSAVSSYNYGNNPSCNAVTVADINCTSYRLDYWGNGVTNGSITCLVASSPLPIELLNFGAKADGDKVNLNWSTATEHNNDFFTVEKSTDGIKFSDALVVKGAGNSEDKRSYTAVDDNPYAGTSYYRLKQTDYDGHTTTFDMIPVTISNSYNVVTNVYPNPAGSDHVNVYVSSGSASALEVTIYSMQGQPLSREVLYPDEKGLVNQPVTLPAEGNLFFMTIGQDGKIIGHHKLCVTRN